MKKIVFVLTLAIATACNAASYIQKYTFAELAGDVSAASLFATIYDGENLYCQLFGNGNDNKYSGITKVGPDGEVTTLVGSADWISQTGSIKMSTFYYFSECGDSLYFAENSTKQAYRVNKNTGEISVIASTSSIFDMVMYDGLTSITLASPGDVSNGDFYFYESRSDNVLVAGAGGLRIGVSNAQLVDLAGNSAISGGMTSDGAGNLFWYSSDSGSIYKWDTANSTGQELLSSDDFIQLKGDGRLSAGDIYFAPDGKMYFFDRNSGIMTFDPDDASSTLSLLMTTDELIAGPAASKNIYGFTWYEGNLAFSEMNEGFFVVPEPGILSLLGMGALTMYRRRRSTK